MSDTIFGADFQHDLSLTSLQTFSGALVDPYTNHVASIMCKNLKPGPQGQRLISSALSNLPNFTTPDEKLSFGWGFDSIVRNFEHFAILAAMAEGFHSSWAAEICHEWAKSVAGPNDILPHLSQWVALLRACNGIFASSDLGVTIEDFIRLDPYSLTWGLTSNKRIPISTIGVVAALQALSAVVNGTEKELTLTGSAVVGWFAAIAETLYDLHVEIFSSEGESISGTKASASPQIRIIYREKIGIEIIDNARPQKLTHTLSHLTITTQQYAQSRHETPFGGRVIWESLLPKIFGESYHILQTSESKPFTAMLGNGARMFAGLALGESPEEDLISAQNKSTPSSYGAGLLSTLSNWLPELRRHQARMERALKLDYPAAAAAYVSSLTTLREACHCGICFSAPGDANEGLGPKTGYCLVVMTESVLALGLTLSRTTVAAQIYPTRAGIQGLYAAQVAKRLEARGQKWQTHFRIVYGNEWNGGAARRLQTICALFSGAAPRRDLPGNLVALAHEGVVAYFLRLERERPRVGEEAVIRVCSGGVNVGGRVFRRAAEGGVEGTGVDDLWERVQVRHLEAGLYCK